jgi:hypothetical protein
MLSNEIKIDSDKDIIVKGSKALIKELGYSGFIRFIRQIEHDGEDYLKIQDEIFKDMSLKQIFEDAKNNWDSKNR